jgi:hypothetical protein
MSERLKKESFEVLKFLPELIKNRDARFKVMVINRNRKVFFIPLTTFEDGGEFKIHSCIMPDECFVLAIFNEKNQLHQINQDSLTFINLSLKEVYFYGKEMHDLDWLYEGDFRQKDGLFYVIDTI